MRLAKLILRNSIRCNVCGDEIVSEHRHDFKGCTCGAVAVDGGQTWLRKIGRFEDWTDTSIIAVCEENDEAAVAETTELLERKRAGTPIEPPSLAMDPTLDAWRVIETRRLPPKRVLVGVVIGHPDFKDGTLLATTGLVALEPEAGWARTTRRFYKLGGRQQ